LCILIGACTLSNKTILLGVEGVENQKWTTKCEQRTPNYLTDINEIMTINI